MSHSLIKILSISTEWELLKDGIFCDTFVNIIFESVWKQNKNIHFYSFKKIVHFKENMLHIMEERYLVPLANLKDYRALISKKYK